MKKQTIWITETAVLLALLIVLQAVTKAAGQFVTGSCVNAVLAVAVLFAGVWSGVTVALLSPFLAFLLGIGPQLLPIVPAISAGNLVFVLVLHLLAGRTNAAVIRKAAGWLAAALAKFAALYLLVVKLLCAILPLAPQQIAVFSSMFSWPQLVTALIGGGLGLLLAAALQRAFHR